MMLRVFKVNIFELVPLSGLHFVSSQEIHSTRGEQEESMLAIRKKKKKIGREGRHTSQHTFDPNVSSPSAPRSPVAPHFDEAAPLFCRSRCVAVATGPSHLPIPPWVCIFRLSPQPRSPRPSLRSSRRASQSHFRLISPSDWFVPLVPSFKVLTFIRS